MKNSNKMKFKLEYILIFLLALKSANICLIECSLALNQNILFNHFGYSIESRVIDLSSQNIDTIDNNTFSGMIYLEKLYLHKNNIVTIERSFFKDLKNLKELWLESNKITRFDKDYLIGLEDLKLVCFKDNPVNELFPNKIKNMCYSNPNCNVKINEYCELITTTTTTTTTATTTTTTTTATTTTTTTTQRLPTYNGIKIITI